MKKRVIALTLCFAAFLCGCNTSNSSIIDDSDNDNMDKYFDISEVKDQIEKTPVNVNFTDFKYDDSPKVWLISGTYQNTLTPSYFFIGQMDDKKWINFNSGRVQSICDIPGCDHSRNVVGCLEHENETIQSVTGATNGIYFQTNNDYNKLFFKNDGEGKKVVFENDFYTNFEENVMPDAKTAFSYFMRDGIMYVIGQSYMYRVDIESMTKIGEPFIISDSRIWNADVSNGLFWITNENFELICCNMENGEIIKVDDKVDRVQCVGNKLYYTTMTDIGVNMYVRSIEPWISDDHLVLKNIENNYYVTDDSIYYLVNKKLYKSDENGENSVEISLSFKYNCGEEYNADDINPVFISCSSCDSIFLVDYDKIGERSTNAIFIIKKGSTKYQTINMGIWKWIPNDPDGKVQF